MRRKSLYIPIITILATILTLLVLLGISTLRNLGRDQVRMEKALVRDGLIVLRGLEASFRSGMRGVMGREDNFQWLMSQISDLTDIRFVGLVDEKGTIIAHSDDALVGSTYPQMDNLRTLIARDEPQHWFAADGSFVVAKRFQPLRSPRGRMGGMRGPMRPLSGMGGTISDSVLPDKTYAVLGLDTRIFVEERKEDIRYAIMMGLILLVLGSASLYFIYLVQNYYLVNKTLNTMTTYATNVVGNMPDGLISIDAEGEIITVNNRVREIFGLRGASDQRRELKKNFLPFATPLLDSLRQNRIVLEQEMEYPHKEGGSIPLAVSAARLISDDKEDLGTVFILRDLREIKALQERVTRSERLAALGSLAAGVAHEIRNPLSSIKGFAQFFLKKNPPGSTDHKYSEVMIQEVERLDRVIANLLDYANPKEPAQEQTSLADIIHRSIALIADEAKAKKVDVIVEIAENIPPVEVDRDQTTQVLLNIALNGLDAMKQGGKLAIRSFMDGESNFVIIEVEDTGHGIPEKELPRIFDPFYTTKKTGTGLGLAIAHRIVENHGGTLSVKSTGKSGTMFRLTVPGS
jgi:two-component system, NtrC family, sensor histidine kinase HydH